MLTTQQLCGIIYGEDMRKSNGGGRLDTRAPHKIGGFEAFSISLGRASKSLEKLKNRGMGEYGLSGMHTLCLRQLDLNADGMTRTQLARRLEVDRAQITRVIEALISAGYVEEIGNGSNYRKKCRLTDDGKKVVSEINGIVERVHGFVSGDIPGEKLEIFYEVFDKICENLERSEELL